MGSDDLNLDDDLDDDLDLNDDLDLDGKLGCAVIVFCNSTYIAYI